MAKSYGFLEQIGYFYNCYNPNSTTRQSFKIKNVDKIFNEILQQYLNCRYFKKDEKENIKNFLNEIRKVKLKKNKI